MSFSPASRNWTTEILPTKAAVTYTAGMMLYNDATDNVPTVAAAQQNIKGIAKEAVASAATTTSIAVLVPLSASSTFYGDMVSGETITSAGVGDQFDFSSTGLTISTTSTYDAVTLVKFISSSKGIFKLNLTTGIEN